MKQQSEPPELAILPVTSERLLMAAWHIGRGKSFEETAHMVGIPIHQLRPIMNYFGIRGRNVGKGAFRLDIVVPSEAMPLIESAAGLRGLEAVEIVERVVREVFTSPALLQNVLDDGKDVR